MQRVSSGIRPQLIAPALTAEPALDDLQRRGRWLQLLLQRKVGARPDLLAAAWEPHAGRFRVLVHLPADERPAQTGPLDPAALPGLAGSGDPRLQSLVDAGVLTAAATSAVLCLPVFADDELAGVVRVGLPPGSPCDVGPAAHLLMLMARQGALIEGQSGLPLWRPDALLSTGEYRNRMAACALLIADGAGFSHSRPPAWRCDLANAIPLHDIGKLAVPDGLLGKPGPLSGTERDLMRRHVERGADIVAELFCGTAAEVALEVVSCHHEAWNGSGYPCALAGEAIPPAGRVTAVAAVFDALTSNRPWKPAWPIHDAFDYLLAGAGTRFDPACVTALVAAADEVIGICHRFAETAVA